MKVSHRVKWARAALAATTGICALSAAHGASVVKQNALTGLVVIEAENFDSASSATATGRNGYQSTHKWEQYASRKGYEGQGAIRAVPVDYMLTDTKEISRSPRANYTVNFSKAGTHYVWVRGFADRSDKDTVHVGIDGNISGSDRLQVSPGKWSWSRNRVSGPVATINVKSAGTHTINVWMRETGFILDKLVITPDVDYSPVTGASGSSSGDSSYTVASSGRSSATSANGVTAYLSPRDGQQDVSVRSPIMADFGGAGLSSIKSLDISVSDGGASIPGRTTFSGPDVVFTPTVPLRNSRSYTARVSGMATSNSGKVVSVNISWKFTTINPDASHILYYNDFDNQGVGRYDRKDLAANWPGANDITNVDDGTVAIERGDGANQGNVMSVRIYGGTSLLGGEGNASGAKWFLPLGRDYEEMYLSYYVKFSKGFDFSGGGKFPGFSGGRGPACESPDGSDFFIDRMVWWPDTRVAQYLYYPGQPTRCGHGLLWKATEGTGATIRMDDGQWHRIETHLKLNTPRQQNGFVESWLDGQLVIRKTGMRFRDVNSLAIDSIKWAVLQGKRTKSRGAQYVYFDDVTVSTRPVGH